MIFCYKFNYPTVYTTTAKQLINWLDDLQKNQ